MSDYREETDGMTLTQNTDRAAPDVEPFDTHSEIDCIRSWGNKDVLRCKACGATQTQTGVRLPDGRLDGPVIGTLTTVVCPAWTGGEQ